MTGYRTYLAAALMAIFGVLASTDWIAFLDNPKAGAVAIGSAAVMALMRALTTTPPGKIMRPPNFLR
ncbi:hypothetical protein [Methylocystis parvus]|uniref:Uncharacterized protein n=1 Tax=Methylocystis parvus TaxID=134 RepID=A0A6B8M1Z6_9HYPH|nr:hypothetical protein [Methylocystis parvus]QGM96335.1 hypothetical protein F7D14_01750 [Methylocystis parvus]WBJ99827.1 hypothetical protein MMG94_17875 [Methylocystis parvus OBBP]